VGTSKRAGSGLSGSSSVFSGVFITEVYGVGNKGSRGLFEHAPDICLFH
jgi:hypothetical protein